MRSGHGDAVCAILGKGGLFSFIHLFSFAISFGYQILFCRTFLIFAKLHRMRGICCSLGEPALKGWLPGSQGQMDGGRGLLDLCSPFPTAFGLARITHGSNTSVHTPLEVETLKSPLTHYFAHWCGKLPTKAAQAGEGLLGLTV